MPLKLPPLLTLHLNSQVTLSFCLIPAGRFRMGSRSGEPTEQPVHWVEITQPFYLGMFPVTQEQLATWPEARARFGQRFPEHTRQPARRLEWSEALSYCEWFTEHCRGQLPSHLTATLPTEAQWEYACRGGTETEYFSGDGPAALSEVAWYFDNAFAAAQDIDKSVQKHTANRWGLVDMHGSVWEWCHDIWDEKAYSKRLDGCADPLVSLSPSGEPVFMARRVVRGGSYLSYLRWCRATYRIGRATDKSYDEVGFRVCLSSNPPANTDRSSLEETLRLLYRDRELARKPG